MSVLNRTAYINQTTLKASPNPAPLDSPSMVMTLITVCVIMIIVLFNYTVFNFTTNTINAVLLPNQSDEWFTKFLSAALLISGFVGAPIGSRYIGRIGDSKGRKKALHFSIVLSLTTAIVAACLPTYTQVGLLAPMLLFIVRLLQGAAMGIPLLFGSVYLVESLPKKSQAFFMSICGASGFLGLIASSNLFFWLQSYLTPDYLLTYGWRLMFIIGALLNIIALFLVGKLRETPLFLQASCHGLLNNSSRGDSDLLQNKFYSTNSDFMTNRSQKQSSSRFNVILLTLFLALIDSSLAFIIIVFLPEFLIVRFSIDTDLLHTAHLISIIGLMAGMIFYGWLNDKIGAAKALMLGSIALGSTMMMFYNYCAHSRALTYFILFYALIGFASGMISITLNILVRLFKVSERLTMTAFIYNTVGILTGAVLPLILIYAVKFISFAPALYIVFTSLVSLIIGFYFYQTPNIFQLEPLPKSYD